MLAMCAAVLAAAGFATEVPGAIRERLLATNETHGAFVQTKRLPDGREFVSRGTYAMRPGRDFVWRTTEPFDTLFRATEKTYVYSNEDECVTRPLSDLKGYSAFAKSLRKGDFSPFFKAFDALYKEDADGTFHILAKPKDSRLKKLLDRVEADGTVRSWTLCARFPDGTLFSVRFADDPPQPNPQSGDGDGGGRSASVSGAAPAPRRED